ncbi:MAG TPA: TMEM175 family protein [Thermoanaerobaculia bacterium]
MTETIRRDSSGFRLRGLGTTRIETFTDAAFAFALTLLAITLDPPRRMADLDAALLNVPAFLLSATMLMMFWWGHHEWSRRYGLDDGASLISSCLLVFTVLIYVYPLRFMFSLMVSWIGHLAGLPAGDLAGMSGPEDVNKVFVIYGVGFSLMAASLAQLNLHAWRRREVLQLDEIERHETKGTIGAWLILAAIGVISTAVALVIPPHLALAGVPGWVYATLGVIMPIYGAMLNRRRRRLIESTAECETVEAEQS